MTRDAEFPARLQPAKKLIFRAVNVVAMRRAINHSSVGTYNCRHAVIMTSMHHNRVRLELPCGFMAGEAEFLFVLSQIVISGSPVQLMATLAIKPGKVVIIDLDMLIIHFRLLEGGIMTGKAELGRFLS
jgi:hypothetical protein